MTTNTNHRKALLIGILGVTCLLGSFLAFVAMQICFMESFWLHAEVFPINPRTLSQPTALTSVGAVCVTLFTLLFLTGAVLVITSVRLSWFRRSSDRPAA
jgi:hypothetical protein